MAGAEIPITMDTHMLNPTATPPATPAALFDFDGTLIGVDTTAQLLAFVARRFPAALQDLVPLTLAFPGFLAGFVARERMKGMAVRALRNVPRQHREGFFREFHDQRLLRRYRRGAMERIVWHRERHHTLVLVSASIDLYLRHVVQYLGFDLLVCTRTTLDPYPRLLGPNCHGAEKVQRLSQETFLGRTNWGESWAYGDDLSDLPMLRLCGHPVAANPGRALRRQAIREGWEIVDW